MPAPAEHTKPADEQIEDVEDDGTTTTEETEEPPAPPAESTPPVSDELTPREKALIQRARAEEKQKLYKDLEQARKALREANEREAARAREEESTHKKRKKNDDEEDELRSEIRSLREEINERERRAELRAYRAERISEARMNGQRVIESLVSGDSEQAIDASLEVAKAEAAYIYAEAERELKAAGNGRKTTIVRDGAPKKPSGVVAPPSSSGSGDETDTISQQELSELTSMESIRNGTWGQNRSRIFKALREGLIRS